MCNLCDMTFKSRDGVLRHIFKKHELAPEIKTVAFKEFEKWADVKPVEKSNEEEKQEKEKKEEKAETFLSDIDSDDDIAVIGEPAAFLDPPTSPTMPDFSFTNETAAAEAIPPPEKVPNNFSKIMRHFM